MKVRSLKRAFRRMRSLKSAVVTTAAITALVLPGIASADLTPTAGVGAGVAVSANTSRALTGQVVNLVENIGDAIGAGNVVLALDNSAKFQRVTVTDDTNLVVTPTLITVVAAATVADGDTDYSIVVDGVTYYIRLHVAGGDNWNAAADTITASAVSQSGTDIYSSDFTADATTGLAVSNALEAIFDTAYGAGTWVTSGATTALIEVSNVLPAHGMLTEVADVGNAAITTTGPTIDATTGKLTIPVTAGGASVATLQLSNMVVNASSSTVATAIQLDDDATSVAGSAMTATTIATVAAPTVTIANATGTIPTLTAAVATDNQTILDINITENVAGAIDYDATGNAEVVMTLPTGWTFASDSQSTYPGTLAASVNFNEEDAATMTIDVTAESTAAGQIAVLGGTTGMTILTPASVAAGDYNATVTVKLSDGTTSTQTVQIATVANLGVTATVVNPASDFTASPTADTALPTSPAGRTNVSLDSIMVVEDLGDSLVTTTPDTLTLTLPTGVTFANNPTVEDSLLTSTHPDPTSFSSMTVTVTNNGTASIGGVLLGDTTTNGMTVDIASTVAAGDIVATITGTAGGTAITPISVTIGTVVDGSTTVTANTTIPTVGIGTSTQAIGAFTIVESVASTLLGNGSTVTTTLPTGVTWSAAPTVTESCGTFALTSNTSTLTSSDSVATWAVTTPSAAACTLTVAGNVDIASTVAAGDITATVAGTAGASGTVALDTAAVGTSVTFGAIPTLTLGTPTQSVSTITITEAFAGAIAASGQFRVVLPSGLTWSEADPTVTTALISGATGTKLVTTVTGANTFSGTATAYAGWDLERGTTFATNDTMIIVAPTTASTGATAVSIAGLKANVSASATAGSVTGTIVDGDLTAASGAGVTGTSAIIGYVGTADVIAADSTTVSLVGTGSSTVTLTGGLGDLSISTDADSTVATTSLASGVLTITGVAAGTTTITISDSSATAQTIDIAVTVVAAATQPTQTTTAMDGSTTAAVVSGGISTDGGATYLDSTSNTITAGTSIDLKCSIDVDAADEGTAGKVYVAGEVNGAFYFRGATSADWTMWDAADATTVVATETPTALADVSLDVLTGLSMPAATTINLYCGYQTTGTTDGPIIFNSTPITVIGQ